MRISAGKSRDKDEPPASSTSTSASTPAGGAAGAASGSAATDATATSGGSSDAKAAASDSAHAADAGSGTNSTSGSTAGHSHSHSHSEEVPSVEKGVDRIIDSHDNEFVLSAPPKDQVATLTLDPLFIQDLTFLFASAAVSAACARTAGCVECTGGGWMLGEAAVGREPLDCSTSITAAAPRPRLHGWSAGSGAVQRHAWRYRAVHVCFCCHVLAFLYTTHQSVACPKACAPPSHLC